MPQITQILRQESLGASFGPKWGQFCLAGSKFCTQPYCSPYCSGHLVGPISRDSGRKSQKSIFPKNTQITQILRQESLGAHFVPKWGQFGLAGPTFCTTLLFRPPCWADISRFWARIAKIDVFPKMPQITRFGARKVWGRISVPKGGQFGLAGPKFSTQLLLRPPCWAKSKFFQNLPQISQIWRQESFGAQLASRARNVVHHSILPATLLGRFLAILGENREFSTFYKKNAPKSPSSSGPIEPFGSDKRPRIFLGQNRGVWGL